MIGKLLLLKFICISGIVQAKKLPESITTISGTHAPKHFRAGDLIFEENFDTLNLAKWQHENTLAGGGVS